MKLVGWSKLFSLQWELWSSVDFSTQRAVGLIIVLNPSDFQETEPDPWKEWMAPKRVQFEYAGKRLKKKSLVSQYLTGLGSLFLLRICILNSESELRSDMVGSK